VDWRGVYEGVDVYEGVGCGNVYEGVVKIGKVYMRVCGV